jgi:hypothetical protein
VTVITQGNVLTELNAAIASYPETNVVLEIEEVEYPGDAVNALDEGFFMVRVINNGDMNLTDVMLKVKGLNGALVKTGGALDVEYREECEISVPDVHGDGNSEVTIGSRLRFKAPSEPSEDGEPQDLFKVTMKFWNVTWDRMLNAHTDALGTPNATFNAEVVGT